MAWERKAFYPFGLRVVEREHFDVGALPTVLETKARDRLDRAAAGRIEGGNDVQNAHA